MKVGVNYGHTLNGPGSGAVGILNESTETRNIGNAFVDLLIKNGHEVVNCTIDKASTQAEYLKKVVEMANRQDLDYFISFHFNAYNGKVFGTEVYTYEGRQFADALEVCANISALGFANRGVKNGTGLYVVKKTKAKSMLIECCFVDNVEDVETYKRVGANAIAEAVYKAIANTNVETVQPQPAPTPQPAPAPSKPTDDWVRRLQIELNAQFGAGLVEDGLRGPKTLNACPTVKKGAKGGITKLIQERLVSVGFNLTVDGIFGENTKKAVKVFQKNRGLTEDGIVGSNTWEWLLKGTKM
ncbi:N-acetylmuramoyl-L-alanine amidase [Thomasclavelia cocleata]|uniref:N-acetylmuramoyl-L-alanine amidase n=1 Tax=Thomasclavelia cocleata TaxID=69824 RepID=UPI00257604F7|nr:N-acetylmuramoyl-L-alanine amidase [Thomasclavelia cocleata]